MNIEKRRWKKRKEGVILWRNKREEAKARKFIVGSRKSAGRS